MEKRAVSQVELEHVQPIVEKTWPNIDSRLKIQISVFVVSATNVIFNYQKTLTPKRHLHSVRRPAHSLLRKMSAERTLLEGKLYPVELAMDGSIGKYFLEQNSQVESVIRVIDDVERSLTALLEIKVPKPDQAPATIIADAVRAGWISAGGTAPISVNPGDPMTLFVVEVLRKIGLGQSERAVSDALRAQGQRPRKVRNSGAPKVRT